MPDDNRSVTTIRQRYASFSVRQLIEDDFEEMFAGDGMSEMYGGAPVVTHEELWRLAAPTRLDRGEARQFAIELMSGSVGLATIRDAANAVERALPKLLNWIDGEVAREGKRTAGGMAAELFHVVEFVAAIEALFAKAGFEHQFLLAARWFYDAAQRDLQHVRGFGYQARPDNPEAWLMLAPVYAVCLAIAVDRCENKRLT